MAQFAYASPDDRLSCVGCRRDLEASAFQRNLATRTGYYSRCRACRTAEQVRAVYLHARRPIPMEILATLSDMTDEEEHLVSVWRTTQAAQAAEEQEQAELTQWQGLRIHAGGAIDDRHARRVEHAPVQPRTPRTVRAWLGAQDDPHHLLLAGGGRFVIQRIVEPCCPHRFVLWWPAAEGNVKQETDEGDAHHMLRLLGEYAPELVDEPGTLFVA